MSLLEVEGLRSGYRGDVICSDVSLAVDANETVCLLGRNGVGKTTLLKTLLGLVPLQAGSVRFNGRDISRLRTDRIAALGVGYVPQGRRLFGRLTVRDNLRLGALPRSGRLEEPDPKILEYFPRVRERLSQKAGTLSGGEQQMVAIARVLVGRPSLILCDEPSEGLQPSIIDDVGRVLLAAARDLGAAVLVVEQNIHLATTVASRGYILEGGRVVQEGDIGEITSEAALNRHVAFSRMSRTPADPQGRQRPPAGG